MNAGRLVLPALRWNAETRFAHESALVEQALQWGAGGFILFGGTVEDVSELTERLVKEAGRPLLIAADLERGAGQQVKGLSELPPPRALASLGDPAVIRGAGILTAIEALSVGINWVLAPVADLDIEPENPIVQTRAFGQDPEQTAAGVAAWVVGCEAAGAMACAKHFPGHGRTRRDSHTEVPVVNEPEDLLQSQDFLPFRAAIAAGVSSVMTAHVAFPALDPSGTPATFSKPILDRLRGELEFSGLIVSDALMMEGAEKGRGPGAVGLDAFLAGVDLLLYPNHPAEVVKALEERGKSDSAAAERIEASLRRYAVALEAMASEDRPERPPPSGAAQALSDWLLDGNLARGAPPSLRAPIELVTVDDDQGGAWPASPNTWLRDALVERGVSLGTGGSKVVLAFAEPRAAKGRSGFSAENLARLGAEVPSADLTILFAHPRLLASISGEGAVLHAWHRQRPMQEAAARWIGAHLA